MLHVDHEGSPPVTQQLRLAQRNLTVGTVRGPPQSTTTAVTAVRTLKPKLSRGRSGTLKMSAGETKPKLQRARSGTLSVEALEELKRAAREADKKGKGKRPKMVRRKSGSKGIVEPSSLLRNK